MARNCCDGGTPTKLLDDGDSFAFGATVYNSELYWSSGAGIRKLPDLETAVPDNPYDDNTVLWGEFPDQLDSSPGTGLVLQTVGEITNDGEFVYVYVAYYDEYATDSGSYIFKYNSVGDLVELTENLGLGTTFSMGSGLEYYDGYLYFVLWQGTMSGTVGLVRRFPVGDLNESMDYANSELVFGIETTVAALHSLTISADGTIWVLPVKSASGGSIYRYPKADWQNFTAVDEFDNLTPADTFNISYESSSVARFLAAKENNCLVGSRRVGSA